MDVDEEVFVVMSSNRQQLAFRRKIIYLLSMIGLFVVTLAVRGIVNVGPGAKWTIQGKAEELELTERAQGESELTGSAVRRLLTGSRGLAICGLWLAAIEKQKKEAWNELELIVNSITKLQPHFLSPWLFQSWNLTYNVSVEMDRLSDMYFYIGRGISLLARGESINKRSPDMRWNIGFYYQNKFGVSDKVNTLRCLMQLSCIPEDERNPSRLLNPDRSINYPEFQRFCEENPSLVRRLRFSTLRYQTPMDIINFLKQNQKLPNRFKEGKILADRLDQYPVLPDLGRTTQEIPFDQPINDALSDGYLAGRAWFAFSLDCVPPPQGKPINNPAEEGYDRTKYRVPRKPMFVIFCQHRARAQQYYAERLMNEGWFDKNTPWIVDEGKPQGSPYRWFKEEVKLFPLDPGYSNQAWIDANVGWKEFGQQYGLDLTPERRAELENRANLYCGLKGATPGAGLPPPPTSEEKNDQELMESYDAAKQLSAYTTNAHVTNFRSFRDWSEVEINPTTLAARKALFSAHFYRDDPIEEEKAKKYYEDGFKLWIQILELYPKLRDQELDRVTEDLYEANLDFIKLLDRDSKERLGTVYSLLDIFSSAQIAVGGNPYPILGYDALIVGKQSLPISLPGPLDGKDAKGIPWLSSELKERVRQRKGGLPRGAPTQNQPPANMAPPGQNPNNPSAPMPGAGGGVTKNRQ